MRSLALGASVLVLSAAALVACGKEGSSGQAAKCQTAKGDDLVVLQDDKHLQTVDNVIPAIYKPLSTPPLVQALDKVSTALDTNKLIGLNRQVDVERKTAVNVASAFVSENNLASGVSGGSGDVQVGAANFGESKILANVYAKVLGAAGFKATVKDVGNRELYLKALSKGEIDVMPEYVGTLTEFLNKRQNGASAEGSRRERQPGLRHAVPGGRPERVRRDEGVRGRQRPEDAVRPGQQVQRRRPGAGRPDRVPGPSVLQAGAGSEVRAEVHRVPGPGHRRSADQDRDQAGPGADRARLLLRRQPGERLTQPLQAALIIRDVR